MRPAVEGQPEKPSRKSGSTRAGITPGGGAGVPAPPAEGLPTAVVDAVLQRCHGILRSAEKMGNVHLTLGTRADDPEPQHITMSSAGGMRINYPDHSVDVCLPKGPRAESGAWRLVAGDAAKPHDAPAAARLRRLEAMLRAALLAPLYRVAKATRQGPNVFALVLPGGATWRLELHSVTPPKGPAVLLPKSLQNGADRIEFVTYRHTGITHLPDEVVLGELGKRWMFLRGSGFVFHERWFSDPFAPEHGKPGKELVQTDAPPVPPDGTPALTTLAPATCLVFDDPGTWPLRFDAFDAHGRELGDLGQQAADLDFVFTEGGKRYVAMPFRMFSLPFVAQPQQKILRLPQQRTAIVFLTTGSLEECERRGATLLREFAAKQGLKAIGPMRARPYIQAEDRSTFDPEKLRVRCELPVGS
ncbi:MAG: hypothetical protein KDC87_20995 [Planctomycetes bacterium]|nr:hypothetical protein [Planctomycetota bacterium]MCB9870723.1 hypothetical protein [Planctomycetota bacterium]MCB9889058.1 hypothetical protein [Planctomycetota bacterium]